MGKVLNPTISVNGSWRDDIQTFTYETARDKTPENTQNPQREAKHVSHGQITYPVNLTLKPVEGRGDDTSSWERLVKSSDESVVLIKEENGRFYMLTGVNFTKISKGGDANTGGTTWTVDGFATHGEWM